MLTIKKLFSTIINNVKGIIELILTLPKDKIIYVTNNSTCNRSARLAAVFKTRGGTPMASVLGRRKKKSLC